MNDDFVRHLHVLLKADSLIGKIWLNLLTRRFGLFVFAGLIAVFGLGMTNIAGFYALQETKGPVWAATIVAIVDFVLAAIVMLVGKNAAPGPEIDLALDVRKMAMEALQADARELMGTIDGFRQEIRDAKNSIMGLAHNPLDAAAQKLLIPAALSIVRGLRSKRGQA
jgi:hypothetical protein